MSKTTGSEGARHREKVPETASRSCSSPPTMAGSALLASLRAMWARMLMAAQHAASLRPRRTMVAVMAGTMDTRWRWYSLADASTGRAPRRAWTG